MMMTLSMQLNIVLSCRCLTRFAISYHNRHYSLGMQIAQFAIPRELFLCVKV